MITQAYAALERGQPLAAYTYDAPALHPHEVRVRVLACGLCHSDVHMIDDDWHLARYPLVPGHEVVGEITEAGSNVTHLATGQRIGVGWQRSACLQCPDCLAGNENLCRQSAGTITHGHGGFADHLVMNAAFCFPIPDDIPTDCAGPLLCAGITVYSGLRSAGLTSGQHVGIVGLGGLGHLAVQFASRLGNRVTVFTSTPAKAEDAIRLGAHDAIVVTGRAFAKRPARPCDIILSTAPAALPVDLYLGLLGTDGVLNFVGVPPGPVSLSLATLMTRRRRVMASAIGGRATILEMLGIAAQFGIRPVIERFPLRDVNQAIDKVRQNTIRYRAVLTA